jgi:Na+/H+ antiporter NhaD/arsenite permease-like protein
LTVSGALQRVDAQSVLFFLGILLAISALQSEGVLTGLAKWMDKTMGNVDLITLMIGLSSSVVDNVPLVAAAQGMYARSTFPTDHPFWLFLAYCAGTGGSILIIGSAAGIAVMGIERISFGWYFRRLSLPALLGYSAGALTYLAIAALGK